MVQQSQVTIQSIIFKGDGGFDIVYAEPGDLHIKGVIIRQLSVPPGVIVTELNQIQEDVQRLLDLALAERYETPESITLHHNR